MSVIKAGLAVATTAFVAVSMLLLPQPAHAAQGNLEVSSDGVTFSKTFAGALFNEIEFLVPTDRQDQRLYLRNTGNAPGFLRVVLEDVQFDDLYFANALTVRAKANGMSGPAIPISLAQPCWVLTEGQRLGAGQVVALDTEMVLGILDGQNGIGASAQVSMAITLSDTTPGSLAPTECGQPDISLPIFPGGSGTGFDAAPDEQIDSPELGPTTGGLPVLNLPGGIVIDPNTWDLWEELFVLLLVVSFLAGSTWFTIGARRRGKESIQDTESTV